MLQVANRTPFSAALSVLPDVRGVETVYVAVKATFVLSMEAPVIAERQVPLTPADVYLGDPATSSLRAAGDLTLPRPSTDVLLVGRAIAPRRDTQVADVSLRVGPVRRTVRVFGDRQWERIGGSWQATTPRTWERMPLQWELALGGRMVSPHDGALLDAEARNPVGRGAIARGGAPMAGQALPNLEDPAALITEPPEAGSGPAPAGFAPIPPHWLPRRALGGTYDEAWSQRRAPYLPLDFDPRFLQAAPPGLIAPAYLRGGESVELTGFSVGEPLCFTLPEVGLETVFEFEGRREPQPANLEMLLFEPDAGRFQMLWRAGLAVDKKLMRMKQVTVQCRGFNPDDHMNTRIALPGQADASLEPTR